MLTSLRLLCTTFILLAYVLASGQALSELALFHRCYSQITSTRIKSTDPLLLAVKNKSKTAIVACSEVLQKAQLTANSNQTIGDTADPVAKSVLTHFHHLHSSWFLGKDFVTLAGEGTATDVRDLYDSTSPAMYITRALFQPGSRADSIVTSSDNLGAIRSTMNPTVGPESGRPITDFVFTPTVSFAPTGELYGIRSLASMTVDYPTGTNPTRPAGKVDIQTTLGGGFLGTQAYLLTHAGTVVGDNFKTDGGVKTHRKWGKAIFHDALCRNLPAVREDDVLDLVNVSSSIPFRTSKACTKCHASQDRVAGVIRSFKITFVGAVDPAAVGVKNDGGQFSTFHPVTDVAEASWPLAPDPRYYARPANGVLFFRDSSGTLQNTPVTSVPDLGMQIAKTDDFYACLAKRYYAHFIGVDAFIGDPEDSAYKNLNAEDLKHRQIVLNLGKNLRTHQNLQTLILDIFKLEHYRKSDFGVRSGVYVP